MGEGREHLAARRLRKSVFLVQVVCYSRNKRRVPGLSRHINAQMDFYGLNGSNERVIQLLKCRGRARVIFKSLVAYSVVKLNRDIFTLSHCKSLTGNLVSLRWHLLPIWTHQECHTKNAQLSALIFLVSTVRLLSLSFGNFGIR